MKISKEYKLAILSGIFIGTSYIPFPPWAILFCMTPLWSQWPKLNVKNIFWTGWLTQFILAIIGFHWIPHSIVEYGNLPNVVGYLGLFAFAALTNLHIPLAGVIWYYLKKKFPAIDKQSTTQSFFTIALLTALLEKLNPQIFPWHLGYTWYFGDWPAYQLSDIIGFSGLSSLTYIINAWILVIALNVRNRKYFQQQVTYFILFFSIINILGLLNVKFWNNTDSNLKVLMVQPNIGNQQKQWELFGSKSKINTIQHHFDLSTPHLAEKPDFIIWPETSIPEFLNREYHHQPGVQSLFQYANEKNIYIVTGAYTHDIRTNKQSNSIFVISPQGKISDNYKKNTLLPFGEFIPLGDIFPSLYELLPMIANFERGRGPHYILAADIKLGPQICYEGLHPWFSKDLVEDQTQVFINVTNDSWFGHTFESYQHLYMTLARAIEFRRPLIRMTNTGISSVADITGKVLVMSPQQKEWAQVVEVPYFKEPKRTIYSYFVHIDLLLVALTLIYLLKPISEWKTAVQRTSVTKNGKT